MHSAESFYKLEFLFCSVSDGSHSTGPSSQKLRSHPLANLLRRRMPIIPLPPAEHLGSLSNAEQEAVLDLLFEPSDAIHSLTESLSGGSSSYGTVIGAIRSELSRWADDPSTGKSCLLDEILASHPRLGEKKVDSQQSRAEQAQLQDDTGADRDALSRLNSLYEETFPGLRYV